MMFATLDDLEGSVELVIFGDTLQECADAIQQDDGRPRQGEGRPQGRDQDVPRRAVVERFEPSGEELAKAEREAARAAAAAATRCGFALDATALPKAALAELTRPAGELSRGVGGGRRARHQPGARQLRLGSGYRVARGAALLAELASLLGPRFSRRRRRAMPRLLRGSRPLEPAGESALWPLRSGRHSIQGRRQPPSPSVNRLAAAGPQEPFS